MRALLASVTFTTLTFVPTAVLAQPKSAAEPAPAEAAATDATVTQARASFRLGATLAKAGQWNDALAAFERSSSLRRHPVTTFNIGYVERALGRLTRAHRHLTEAEQEGAADGPTPLPPDLAASAQGYLAEIAEKLCRVTVTLAAADLRVAIGGRPLSPLSPAGDSGVLAAGLAESGPGTEIGSSVFELALDPGTHVIVVSDASGRSRVVSQAFTSGTRSTLTLALPDDEPAPVVTPVQSPAPAEPTPAPAAAPPPEPDRTWAYVAYGVGAAGVLVGGVTGTMALLEDRKLEKACTNGECSPADMRRANSNERLANVATIGWIVGGVGAAVGTLLLVLPDSGEIAISEGDHASLSLQVGPTMVRAVGRF